MNTTQLEAFLKAQCGPDFLDLHMDLNDHKSCYGTIQDHEQHYKNIVYKWVTEEEQQAAYATDEMWSVAFNGAGKDSYMSATGHKLAATLKRWSEVDEEVTRQAEELTSLLRSQLQGKNTSAHVTYTVGQAVSQRKGKVWVETIENVAMMVIESHEFSDIDEWISPEERQKAIDNNGIWSVQIFPNTPIGSYSVHASSLQVIVDYLMQPD